MESTFPTKGRKAKLQSIEDRSSVSSVEGKVTWPANVGRGDPEAGSTRATLRKKEAASMTTE